jgi:hypothetical protein
MRSATTLFFRRGGNGTRRRWTPARARLAAHRLRHGRRQGCRPADFVARPSLRGIPARPPLCRVRPLKVLPRGVVPYVKH